MASQRPISGRRRTIPPVLRRGCLLAALLLLFHPGGRSNAAESAGTLSLPPAMGRLVPADAVGLLYLTSIDGVEADVRKLTEAFKTETDSSKKEGAGGAPSRSRDRLGEEESGGKPDFLGALLKPIGIDPARVDRKRPLAIALGVLDMGQPVPLPTYILPVADWKGLREDLQARPGIPAPVESGGYAGVAMIPGYAPGDAPPPIATNLPARHAVLRLRAGRIMTVLQPFIEPMFAAMMNKAQEDSGDVGPGSAAADQQSTQAGMAMLQLIMDHLRSCETLDLGLAIDAGRLDFDYAAVAVEGGEHPLISPSRARGLMDLARCLPHEYPAVSLMAMDYTKLADVLEPVTSGLSQGEGKGAGGAPGLATLAWTKQSLALNRLIKDQMLMAGRLGEQGLEMIQVMAVHDPRAYLTQLREVMDAPLMAEAGMIVEWEDPGEIDGLPVTGYRFRFDMEKLMRASADQSGLPEEDREAASEKTMEFMNGLFGDDGMTVRMAAVGDRIVMVSHPDATLLPRVVRNLRDGTGQLPAALSRLAGETTDPLCLWYEVDLRTFLPPFASLAADGADPSAAEVFRRLAEGKPARLSAFTTVSETGYRGRLGMDVDGFGEIFRSFSSLMPDESSDETPGTLEEAQALFLDNHVDEALPAFESLAEEDPEDPDRQAWLAEALRRSHRLEEAQEAAERAVAADPCHAFAHQVLADLFNPQFGDFGEGKEDESWDHLMKAVECDPGDGNAWVRVWPQAMRRGDRDLERRAIRQMGEAGFITPAALAYNAWVLEDLPPNAVLLTNGDMDTYPALVLQELKNVRRDVAVVNVPLLNLAWYRELLASRFDLPPVAFAETRREEDGDFVTAAEQTVRAWLADFDRDVFRRPLTLATTISDLEFRPEMKDHLQLAGGYYLYHTDIAPDPVDLTRVRNGLKKLEAGQLSGPLTSEQDRSPIRRANPKGLLNNVGAAVIRCADHLADKGEGDEARELLAWLEDFRSRGEVPWSPEMEEALDEVRKKIEAGRR